MTLCLALWALATWSYRDGIARLAVRGSGDLDLYVAHLHGLLAKYEPLPELLATNPRLVDFLRAPGGRESIEALNSYLATINRISDAADTYLMDAEGLTIAASNWDAERPFIGRNFSFRPYFRDAMDGELGRYFALGTTSRQRGYYFAYPVRDAGDILGAVVVKIDIAETERQWAKPDRVFLVTDPDGVIFVSTRPEQRFRTLFSIDATTRQRIRRSHRYPNAAIRPLDLRLGAEVDDGWLVHPTSDRRWPPRRAYLLQSRAMQTAGWHVHELTDTREALRNSLRLTLLAAAMLIMSGAIGALVLQRQRARRANTALAEQTQASLERMNLVLEERVATRTVELTRSNQRLRDEIDERRRAEQALREAQQALIQSAKLATLGQMSASINHELNQPLAAIRTYADNGRLLLRKGRAEEVAGNLEHILALTDRMARIGAQFKLFARKTSGELTALPLAPVVESAARIAAPLLASSDGRLRIDVAPDLTVRVNDVLLQQVLVNLLGNACQAIAGFPQRAITLTAERMDGEILVRVADTGQGIREADIERIFEPFFTTKAAGEGLGLGLTISARIASEMGGTLFAVHREQGACLELRLRSAENHP